MQDDNQNIEEVINHVQQFEETECTSFVNIDILFDDTICDRGY